MPFYHYKNISPCIGDSCFIAPDATLIGRVTLGENSSVWFRTVLRGDVSYIEVGARTNVQDLSLLHVSDDIPLIIGDEVTIGHSVTLHSCKVEDNCLIGMGATILDNVVVGKNSIVAAGSLCPPGKIYPSYSMIVGNPAKAVRKLSEEERELYGQHYKKYLLVKDEFLDSTIFGPLEEV